MAIDLGRFLPHTGFIPAVLPMVTAAEAGTGSYGYGGAYAVPYYVPVYDSSSGYDSGGGGPYLYSGPAAEQTLHIVVDLAPSRNTADD